MVLTKFFCLHTSGSPYAELARDCCQRSFKKFNIDVKLLEFGADNTWMKNCLRRTILLNELALGQPNDSICLLDADVECLKTPHTLLNFYGDIAVNDLIHRDPAANGNRSTRYSAGVSIFAPSKLGRWVLSDWANRCKIDANPEEWLREQVYLYESIEAARSMGLNLTNIGLLYNRVPEDRVSGDDTVILHHVASRKTLAQMGGSR